VQVDLDNIIARFRNERVGQTTVSRDYILERTREALLKRLKDGTITAEELEVFGFCLYKTLGSCLDYAVKDKDIQSKGMKFLRVVLEFGDDCDQAIATLPWEYIRYPLPTGFWFSTETRLSLARKLRMNLPAGISIVTAHPKSEREVVSQPPTEFIEQLQKKNSLIKVKLF
jgi:hypothetical protein